ncbi:MAG: hypothetical protein FWD90_01920 [Defluviitaleaceae bacterium]|nr:hypothetical protein [Defluviitaleaceae bacterium]
MELTKVTISRFAQELHPYFSRGKIPADFMVMLTNGIMTRPGDTKNRAAVRKGEDPDYLNPIKNKGQDYRRQFFTDDRTIPATDITEILGRLDKQRFGTFISKYPIDVRLKLVDILKSFEVKLVNIENVAVKCAEFFEVVLISELQRKRGNV